MNKRLQELMRQACKKSFRPESVLEDVPQDVLEKFAELIAKECADLCENSKYTFGTIFAKIIKHHFGVEK